jgi:hypothetical protein
VGGPPLRPLAAAAALGDVDVLGGQPGHHRRHLVTVAFQLALVERGQVHDALDLQVILVVGRQLFGPTVADHVQHLLRVDEAVGGGAEPVTDVIEGGEGAELAP